VRAQDPRRKKARMRIEKVSGRRGVQVNLEPEECELFVRLAQDAALAGAATEGRTSSSPSSSATYFSVSLNIGRGIVSLLNPAR
jgi:hypothetical protein